MHVAMYAPALPSTGSPNGIVTYVRVMQTALQAAGHRVTVFDRCSIAHHDGSVEQVGADRRLTSRLREVAVRSTATFVPQWPVRFQHVVERVHAAYPIDVLEVEESFGWAGRLRVDAPVVARLHGPHAFVRDERESVATARVSAARVRAERASIARTAAVTSPSSRLLERTCRHYGARPSASAVIRNPMPLAAELWSAGRAKANALLFVGRFDSCKGADLALRAFALALRSVPDLTLTMCGPDRGIVDDTGACLSFAEWTHAHLSPEVRERVTFIAMADAEQLEALRCSSSLMISTSRYDTFPYSVAEALACGLPVLLPDMVGLSEILVPGESAYAFPDRDVHGAARTIVAALADRERLAAVGAGGRAACAEHLSPDRVAAETIAFYEQVLARR